MRRKFTLTIVYTLSILTGCSRQARDIDKINTLLDWENTIDGVYSDEQFEKVFKLIEDNPKTLDYDFSEAEIDSDSFVTLTGRYRRFGWQNGVFKNVTLMEPFEVKNDKYYIRIEQNRDGSCIYRCWNGGVKQGKPDLTIRNGLRQLWSEEGLVDYDKWISLDEYTPLGEKYTFKNKGYEYVYLSGWSKGRTYEDLKVYSPAGEMIYSGSFIPVSQAISVPQI